MPSHLLRQLTLKSNISQLNCVQIVANLTQEKIIEKFQVKHVVNLTVKADDLIWKEKHEDYQ